MQIHANSLNYIIKNLKALRKIVSHTQAILQAPVFFFFLNKIIISVMMSCCKFKVD